nr:type II toxin-antitoxin system PemK/MazF family toxin [Mycolicibacter engbaekii]
MGRTGLIWRGEVYDVDLGQPVGREPAFRRPAVVVSVDILNSGPGGLVVVVPVTTTGYGLRSHVELEPASSGLDHTSYARCDQLRVVSIERLSSRQGMIGPEPMQAIDRALRFVLDL